ncbi:Histone-Lysine N-Methyltransferase ash1l [Mortierella alpina]|uniref:Histone-Lysine N-Methyltransferase ash1l n=1 Tax=Mortierella alpina TaxID=64518 RepID=A0A9P6JE11_MORAP|nr:Histone-Lysine N-Methyltransferase ash1l [Mortierella alpina]
MAVKAKKRKLAVSKRKERGAKDAQDNAEDELRREEEEMLAMTRLLKQVDEQEALTVTKQILVGASSTTTSSDRIVSLDATRLPEAADLLQVDSNGSSSQQRKMASDRGTVRASKAVSSAKTRKPSNTVTPRSARTKTTFVASLDETGGSSAAVSLDNTPELGSSRDSPSDAQGNERWLADLTMANMQMQNRAHEKEDQQRLHGKEAPILAASATTAAAETNGNHISEPPASQTKPSAVQSTDSDMHKNASTSHSQSSKSEDDSQKNDSAQSPVPASYAASVASESVAANGVSVESEASGPSMARESDVDTASNPDNSAIMTGFQLPLAALAKQRMSHSVISRQARTIYAPDTAKASETPEPDKPKRRPGRPPGYFLGPTSCAYCRQQHRRCDYNQVCHRCTKAKIPCDRSGTVERPTVIVREARLKAKADAAAALAAAVAAGFVIAPESRLRPSTRPASAQLLMEELEAFAESASSSQFQDSAQGLKRRRSITSSAVSKDNIIEERVKRVATARPVQKFDPNQYLTPHEIASRKYRAGELSTYCAKTGTHVAPADESQAKDTTDLDEAGSNSGSAGIGNSGEQIAAEKAKRAMERYSKYTGKKRAPGRPPGSKAPRRKKNAIQVDQVESEVDTQVDTQVEPLSEEQSVPPTDHLEDHQAKSSSGETSAATTTPLTQANQSEPSSGETSAVTTTLIDLTPAIQAESSSEETSATTTIPLTPVNQAESFSGETSATTTTHLTPANQPEASSGRKSVKSGTRTSQASQAEPSSGRRSVKSMTHTSPADQPEPSSVRKSAKSVKSTIHASPANQAKSSLGRDAVSTATRLTPSNQVGSSSGRRSVPTQLTPANQVEFLRAQGSLQPTTPTEVVKRGPGRPPWKKPPLVPVVKRPVGRPPNSVRYALNPSLIPPPKPVDPNFVKRGPGRPPKASMTASKAIRPSAPDSSSKTAETFSRLSQAKDVGSIVPSKRGRDSSAGPVSHPKNSKLKQIEPEIMNDEDENSSTQDDPPAKPAVRLVKKVYLKSGLYSADHKVNPVAAPSNSKLAVALKSGPRQTRRSVTPVGKDRRASCVSSSSDSTPFFQLPINYGAVLMSKQRDFFLPFDIMQAWQAGHLRKTMQPEPFIKIRSNIFVERKRRTETSPMVCHCIPPPPGSGKVGCGEDCYNRVMFYECVVGHCPCGDLCSNRRFQQKHNDDHLRVIWTKERGFGIQTTAPIRKGSLVIEYRGEVISQTECHKRMEGIYKNNKNFYFLEYEKGEVVDACQKGTNARFVNHSCSPNSQIEKWYLNGEMSIGIFASQDIPAGTEISYDYNFSSFRGAQKQKCRCGATNCRGYIGERSSKNKELANGSSVKPPGKKVDGRKQKAGRRKVQVQETPSLRFGQMPSIRQIRQRQSAKYTDAKMAVIRFTKLFLFRNTRLVESKYIKYAQTKSRSYQETVSRSWLAQARQGRKRNLEQVMEALRAATQTRKGTNQLSHYDDEDQADSSAQCDESSANSASVSAEGSIIMELDAEDMDAMDEYDMESADHSAAAHSSDEEQVDELESDSEEEAQSMQTSETPDQVHESDEGEVDELEDDEDGSLADGALETDEMKEDVPDAEAAIASVLKGLEVKNKLGKYGGGSRILKEMNTMMDGVGTLELKHETAVSSRGLFDPLVGLTDGHDGDKGKRKKNDDDYGSKAGSSSSGKTYGKRGAPADSQSQVSGSQKRVMRDDSDQDEESYAPTPIRPTGSGTKLAASSSSQVNIAPEDFERLIKDVVRLAIFTSHSDAALKRDDIRAGTKSYYLRNILPQELIASPVVDWESESADMGLLMVTLALIMVREGSILENVLMSHYRRMHLLEDASPFGEVTKKLEMYIKKRYLERIKLDHLDDSGEKAEIEYRWGARARVEVPEENVIKFIQEVFGREAPSTLEANIRKAAGLKGKGKEPKEQVVQPASQE